MNIMPDMNILMEKIEEYLDDNNRYPIITLDKNTYSLFVSMIRYIPSTLTSKFEFGNLVEWNGCRIVIYEAVPFGEIELR